MPFGEAHLVFRIEGKIFLCLSLGTTDARFAIKLAPERNEELRMQHDSVTPAYHWNKKHWSDIYYENGLSDAQIESWIRESHALVTGKLPKAVRIKYMSKE